MILYVLQFLPTLYAICCFQSQPNENPSSKAASSDVQITVVAYYFNPVLSVDPGGGFFLSMNTGGAVDLTIYDNRPGAKQGKKQIQVAIPPDRLNALQEAVVKEKALAFKDYYGVATVEAPSYGMVIVVGNKVKVVKLGNFNSLVPRPTKEQLERDGPVLRVWFQILKSVDPESKMLPIDQELYDAVKRK
jgi:hypothetical protein